MYDPRTGELISDARFDPITGEALAESLESDPLSPYDSEDISDIPVAIATSCSIDGQLPMAMAMPAPVGMNIGQSDFIEPHRTGALPIAAESVVIMPDDMSYGDRFGMREEDSSCAQMGCILSLFIPIAGWITAYYNIGAPVGSRRRKYGT